MIIFPPWVLEGKNFNLQNQFNFLKNIEKKNNLLKNLKILKNKINLKFYFFQSPTKTPTDTTREAAGGKYIPE